MTEKDYFGYFADNSITIAVAEWSQRLQRLLSWLLTVECWIHIQLLIALHL